MRATISPVMTEQAEPRSGSRGRGAVLAAALAIVAIPAVVLAVGGCISEKEVADARTTTATPSNSLDGEHTYAALTHPIVGPPPVFPGGATPPSLRSREVTSYRVGSDDRYPAYLVITETATCLYARGDDGVGGACSDSVGPNGVISLGEIRANGRYMLSAVVPDDVTAVESNGRSVTPLNNLVRIPLRYGTTEVTFRSKLRDSTLTFTARRP